MVGSIIKSENEEHLQVAHWSVIPIKKKKENQTHSRREYKPKNNHDPQEKLA